MATFVQLSKQAAAILSRHPLQSGGFPGCIAFAEAAGHVVPKVEIQPGVTCQSADDRCFEIGAQGMARARAIAARHQRYSHYMKETRHGWTVVEGSETAWADNSRTAIERSTLTGATRTKWLESPHGDACY